MLIERLLTVAFLILFPFAIFAIAAWIFKDLE